MSLIDYGNNKDYMNNIKENLNNIVPFLGSGISIPYGYPSWSELLIRILDNIRNVTNIADDTNERIKNIINEKHYIKATNEIHKHWPNLEDYVCNEISTIKPNPNSCSSLAEYIHLFPLKLYLTTNYDSVVEKILQSYFGNNLNVEVISSLITPKGLKRGKPTLIYLHGKYTEPNSVIFTKTDYNDFYGDSEVTYNKDIDRRPLARILRDIYLQYPFLFIGCGMNMEEDRILKLLQMITKLGPLPPNYSYALLDNGGLTSGQINKKENLLLSLRVKPIWYSSINGINHEQAKKELFEYILGEEREKFNNWQKEQQEKREMELKKLEEEKEEQKKFINIIEESSKIVDRIPYYQNYYSSDDNYEFILINVTVNDDNRYYLSDQGKTFVMLDKIFELKEPDVVKNLIAIMKECEVQIIGDKLLVHLAKYNELKKEEQQKLLEEAKCKLFSCVSFMDKMRIFYI